MSKIPNSWFLIPALNYYFLLRCCPLFPILMSLTSLFTFFSTVDWYFRDRLYSPFRRGILGSLKSYDGNYNENVTLKLNFALSKVFCDYSMLVRLYKIGGVHFRLLGTNVFHLKLKKDLVLRARVVVRTSNMKISRRRLADYVKTLQQKACYTCSTIIFLLSTNQIIDLWRCR